MGVERMAGSHPDYGMAEPVVMDRARPRGHEGPELRADARPLDAGPPRARLQRPSRHPDAARGADLGARYVQGHDGRAAAGAHAERPRAAARDDRAEPEPPERGHLGPVQRDRRPEPARVRVRETDARGGEAPRSAAACRLRFELAAEDARARRHGPHGHRRVERVLRKLVRRHGGRRPEERGADSAGVSGQAHHRVGVRLLRVHAGADGGRRPPERRS